MKKRYCLYFFKMIRFRKLVAVCLVGLLFINLQAKAAPVDHPADPDNTDMPTVVARPFTLSLLVTKKNGASNRLVMPIQKIGSKQVNVKVVFDSGSEGLILDAFKVLPSDMITPEGIAMNGHDSFVVNGIRITSIKDSTTFGALKEKKRLYFGQIAYAKVIIGDDFDHLITREMPFLLVYKGFVPFTGKPAKLDPVLDGICGVYSGYVSFNDNAMARKELKSPFDYVNYADNLHAGFALNPIHEFVSSDANDGTYPVPMLKVGLTANMESRLHIYEQQKNRNGTYSPLAWATITLNDQSLRSAVLLDTGTPSNTFIFNTIFNSESDVNEGSNVKFGFPDFSYDYTVDKHHKTISGPGTRSVLPIGFFDEHTLLLDYQSHKICFL